MIAAALIAASVLAPSGTATIQADPVCLSQIAQPGHSYQLTIAASGGNLAVVPDRLDAAPLRQVPPSWVSLSASSVTLSVPQDAAAGPYQSLIEVAAAGVSGGDVSLGAAATTALVFTVGPSAVAPPPCDALDLAQSTGKFPAWPGPAFATTGWKQVFARERASEPKPLLSPTAGTGAPAPAGQYAPASPAASRGIVQGASEAGGTWVLITFLVLCVLGWLKRRRS